MGSRWAYPPDAVDWSHHGEGHRQKAAKVQGSRRSSSCSGLRVVQGKRVPFSGCEMIVPMAFRLEHLQQHQLMNRWRRVLENSSTYWKKRELLTGMQGPGTP